MLQNGFLLYGRSQAQVVQALMVSNCIVARERKDIDIGD